MVVVVAGMHRTGTSLVSSILISLGVHMGDKLLRPTSSQPYGHFEDVDFYEMNKRILKEAGGSWCEPPSHDLVLQVELPIAELVSRKAKKGRNWGWKDPRNCLTLPLYHPYLENPRYVRVIRDVVPTTTSLKKRSKRGELSKWTSLYHLYYERLDAFLADKDYVVVKYEEINPVTIGKLNDFIDGNGNVEGAMRRVH